MSVGVRFGFGVGRGPVLGVGVGEGLEFVSVLAGVGEGDVAGVGVTLGLGLGVGVGVFRLVFTLIFALKLVLKLGTALKLKLFRLTLLFRLPLKAPRLVFKFRLLFADLSLCSIENKRAPMPNTITVPNTVNTTVLRVLDGGGGG